MPFDDDELEEVEEEMGSGFDPDKNAYYFDASDGSISRALALFIKTPKGKDLNIFVSVMGVMIDYEKGSAFFRYEEIDNLMYEFFGDNK